MALYHLSVKPVSRSGGRSAVACAAYRSADVLHDQRTGQVHDYQRKQGVEARLLMLADGAGELLTMEGEGWTAERERLWNAAEAAEKRKDARVGREYEVALPHELDADARRRLVAAFGRELVGRYGVAVDAAVHAPGREGDQRNWHAHVLTTTRKATSEGLGEKAEIELSDAARGKLGLGKAADEIEGVRALWGGLVNRALEHARVAERVDHRSYERQGLGHRTATQHAGPAVSNMERAAEAKRRRAEVRGRPERAAEASGRVLAGVETSAAAEGPGMAQAAPERPQAGQEGPQEAARAVPAPAGVSGPAQGRQGPLAAREGLGGPRSAQEGAGAPRAVETPVPGQGGPARASAGASAGAGAAGMHGSGAEPVTRVGRRNAEIQARNRVVEAARAAWGAARARVERLERAAAAGARWVAGLARGVGRQVAAEREQRAAQAREAARAALARVRAAEEAEAAQERAAAARQAALRRQAAEREEEREREQAAMRRAVMDRLGAPSGTAGWDAAAHWQRRLVEEGRELRERQQAERDRARERPEPGPEPEHEPPRPSQGPSLGM